MLVAKCIEDIEDFLPPEAIDQICVSRQNDEAVKDWADILNIKLNKKWNVKEYLYYQGFEEQDLQATYHQIECLIWIAAWNRFENEIRENNYA